MPCRTRVILAKTAPHHVGASCNAKCPAHRPGPWAQNRSPPRWQDLSRRLSACGTQPLNRLPDRSSKVKAGCPALSGRHRVPVRDYPQLQLRDSARGAAHRYPGPLTHRALRTPVQAVAPRAVRRQQRLAVRYQTGVACRVRHRRPRAARRLAMRRRGHAEQRRHRQQRHLSHAPAPDGHPPFTARRIPFPRRVAVSPVNRATSDPAGLLPALRPETCLRRLSPEPSGRRSRASSMSHQGRPQP